MKERLRLVLCHISLQTKLALRQCGLTKRNAVRASLARHFCFKLPSSQAEAMRSLQFTSHTIMTSTTPRVCLESLSHPNTTAGKKCSTKLRVRFGNLPRIDRRTGSVVDSEVTAPASKPTTCGNEIDQKQDLRTLQSTKGKDKSAVDKQNATQSFTSKSIFREVKWQIEAHPGRRIVVDAYECESISPRSSTTNVDPWSLEADTQWFRGKVQPRRATGQRKPGMTARKPVRKEEEDEEGCVVQ